MIADAAYFQVFFEVITGRPSEVAATMRRRVSAYTREHLGRRFKIGITADPIGRARGYSDYNEMTVLYLSSSLESISEVERDLIEHNKHITPNRIVCDGGNYGKPPYYLYIVVD
jgi:hypothetical protein